MERCSGRTEGVGGGGVAPRGTGTVCDCCIEELVPQIMQNLAQKTMLCDRLAKDLPYVEDIVFHPYSKQKREDHEYR